MDKLGAIEILDSTCNISTVKDLRGGIFTWIPKEPIVEFNLLYFSPGKVRGNHQHPEFIEYFLIVDGTVVVVTKRPSDGSELIMHASKGTCFRTPKGVSHAVHAITNATCVSLLTKAWDDCSAPIIHEELIPFDESYREYAKSTGFQHSVEELKTKK